MWMKINVGIWNKPPPQEAPPQEAPDQPVKALLITLVSQSFKVCSTKIGKEHGYKHSPGMIAVSKRNTIYSLAAAACR